MAEIAWSNFDDYVLPSVPGCPRHMVRRYAREVTQEFMEKTRIYRLSPTAVSGLSDTSEYSLSYSVGNYQPVEIFKPYYGTTPLRVSTEQELDERVYNWSNHTDTTPQSVFLTMTRKLHVYPTPSANLSSSITMSTAVTVNEDATTVSDEIFDEYKRPIIYGILERLYELAGQEWYSEQLAKANHWKFRRECQRFRNIVLRERTGNPSNVRPRDTFIIT